MACIAVTNVMTKYQVDEDEGKEGDERTSRGDTKWANILPPLYNDIKRELRTLDIDDLATGQRTRWQFSFSPCSQSRLAVPGFSETLLMQTTVKKWGKRFWHQADDTKLTVSAFCYKWKTSNLCKFWRTASIRATFGWDTYFREVIPLFLRKCANY